MLQVFLPEIGKKISLQVFNLLRGGNFSPNGCVCILIANILCELIAVDAKEGV